MTFAFPKEARLLKRFQFRQLNRSGRLLEGRYIVLKWRKTRSPQIRLGITVKRKFGKAHERNRFKRLVREGFRIVRHELCEGVELLVFPKVSAKSSKLKQIMQDLRETLPAHLFREKPETKI